MSRRQLVECPISMDAAEPFEPDIGDAEDPELPEGWVQITLQRVVANPEYDEAVTKIVDQYVKAAQQEQGGDKLDLNRMRSKLRTAILEGEVEAALPDRHILIEVEEHFSPDALAMIKAAFAPLKLPQLTSVFE